MKKIERFIDIRVRNVIAKSNPCKEALTFLYTLYADKC
jgi:hypothetical protein